MGMTKALIVVDVQNDFCEGGSLAVEGGREVAQRIYDELIVPDEYWPVVATKDWHIDPGTHWSDSPDYVDSWPVHCAADTEGASFCDPLMVDDFTYVFYKGEYEAAYSGFEGWDVNKSRTLGTYLHGQKVQDVDVVGLALDYCVKATALDAVEAGFNVRILLPYTAAVHPDQASEIVEELAEAGVTFETD